MRSSSICWHAVYSQMHLRQRASSIQGAKYTKCIKNFLGLLWKLCPCWLLRHVQALGYLVLWNWCILVVRRFPASHFPPWVDSSLSAAVSHNQSYSNLMWLNHRWSCNKKLLKASNDTKCVRTLSGLAFHENCVNVLCRSSHGRRKTRGDQVLWFWCLIWLRGKFRHGICHKLYTAGFSGQKFYTINFT